MCLAQGPQGSDAGEAKTGGPSVSSQALYHWAPMLPWIDCGISWYYIFYNQLNRLLEDTITKKAHYAWFLSSI